MKSIKNINISAIVLALLILFPLTAYAVSVGNVTHVTGRVDITSPGEAAMPANVGDEVNENDIIRTKSKSKAEIAFLDGNILRLAEETRVEIAEYMIEEEQVVGILNLFRGKLQNIVSTLGKKYGPNKRNRFEVHTPTAVCGVRGTNFFPWYLKGVSGATFKKGKGYLYSKGRPDDIKSIRAGQTGLVVSADQPPRVRPATDKEMGEHEDDTFPSDDDDGDGDDGDDEGEGEGEGGTPEGYSPPEDEGSGDTGGDDAGGLGLNTGLYIPPDLDDDGGDDGGDDGPTTTYTDFSDPISFDFPEEDTTLSGSINDDTDEGTLDLSGSTSEFPEDTWEGDFSATLSDESALEGYFVGISGTWEGLLTSIYVTEDGDAGYIYGDLSGGYDSDDKTFSGSGSATRSSMGSADISYYNDLAEALNDSTSEANDVLSNMEIPVFDDIDIENGQIVELGSLGSPDEIMGISTTDGSILGIWRYTIWDWGSYSSDGALYTAEDPWQGTYGDGDDYDEYYMLGDISGTDDLVGHVTITGNLTYLDTEYLGSISLEYRGTYDNTDDITAGTYESIGAGTFTLEPLAYSGYWEGDSLYYYDSEEITWAGDEYGLIGGLTAPWDEPADFLAMGYYEDDAETGGPYFWASDIDADGDGGYFEGITGGIWKDGDMKGAVLAIYVNTANNTAGILTDYDVSGNYYENLEMWMAEGTLTPVEMPEGYSTEEIIEDTIDITGDGSFADETVIAVMANDGISKCIENQDWGIWGTMLGGTYIDTDSQDWTLHLIDDSPTSTHWVEVAGSITWPGEGEIAETSGRAAGAWVDLDDAITGVIGGETIGTFNPTEETWQAVAAGSWMETRKFLDMASVEYNSETGAYTFNTTTDTLAGTQALLNNDLNIPCIEVGRTDLTGSNENMTVNMNDVTFFAYSTGASPKIWATGDVSGSYSANPVGSTAVLTGNGFNDVSAGQSVNFIVNSFGAVNGNWDASVNGAGTVSGYAIDIDGAAAGTVVGEANDAVGFTGTGAGVATPTQEETITNDR